MKQKIKNHFFLKLTVARSETAKIKKGVLTHNKNFNQTNTQRYLNRFFFFFNLENSKLNPC